MTLLTDKTDPQQIEALLRKVTLDIFLLMVPVEIAPGEGKNEDFASESDITSMIGLAGDMKGFLAVHCPAAVAKAITAAMLGIEIHTLDEDVRDALGEVVNMIAGGLKSGLLKAGKNMSLALPTSIVGKKVRTRNMTGITRCLVPFSTTAGVFIVELAYILE